MGFEKTGTERQADDQDFVIPVSDTQAYRQFGNSVVVPVFRGIARLLEPYIKDDITARKEAQETEQEVA